MNDTSPVEAEIATDLEKQKIFDLQMNQLRLANPRAYYKFMYHQNNKPGDTKICGDTTYTVHRDGSWRKNPIQDK